MTGRLNIITIPPYPLAFASFKNRHDVSRNTATMTVKAEALAEIR